MVGADVVKDVEHHGAVAGAHFVDYEVVVWIEGELVIGHHVASHCFAIVGSEEFGGRVP